VNKSVILNGLCAVEGDVEEAIRTAFLKLDEDMTHGVYIFLTLWCCDTVGLMLARAPDT